MKTNLPLFQTMLSRLSLGSSAPRAFAHAAGVAPSGSAKSPGKSGKANIVLVDAVRTPFAQSGTVYKKLMAVDLQRHALKCESGDDSASRHGRVPCSFGRAHGDSVDGGRACHVRHGDSRAADEQRGARGRANRRVPQFGQWTGVCKR